MHRKSLPNLMTVLFSALGTGMLQAQTWVVSNLADLQTCIGTGGSAYSTCQLSPGVYSVSTPLQTQRSNFTITGTMSAGPADTVLTRGVSTLPYILEDQSGVTNVTIQYLTFDGNRYGFGIQGQGISCLNSLASGSHTQATVVDLYLRQGGSFTVQWVDFINSPDTALWLSGGSTLSFSNFGQGTAPGSSSIGPGGYAPAGGLYGYQSGSRFTSAVLSGGSAGPPATVGSGAWYNAIAYAGTAGAAVDGYDQTIYGDQLIANRYEMSDGAPGGQLVLWQGWIGTAAYTSVAGSVINGANYTWTDSTATGCTKPLYGNPPGTPEVGPFTSSGAEVNGIGHRFFNNEVSQHEGGGIAVNLDASIAQGQLTVSSANPWYGSDTPRYIEGNAWYGIYILGPGSGMNDYQGASFVDVLVSSNAPDGIGYDTLQNYPATNPTYTGFAPGIGSWPLDRPGHFCSSSRGTLTRDHDVSALRLFQGCPEAFRHGTRHASAHLACINTLC